MTSFHMAYTARTLSRAGVRARQERSPIYLLRRRDVARDLLLRKLYGHFWAAQIGRPLGAATQTSDLWRLWRVHRSIKVAFEQPLSARRGAGVCAAQKLRA